MCDGSKVTQKTGYNSPRLKFGQKKNFEKLCSY